MGLPLQQTAGKPARLVSLDAYRGFIMLVMASGGLAVLPVALRGQPFWEGLSFQLQHVDWTGCTLWDLIQPSFMFMVGVAMPFSIASRRARGDSERKIYLHALYRSVVLILLGIFLSSNHRVMTDFTFVNVLTQIGLGYMVVLLLLGRGWKVQLLVTVAVLAGYWLLFALYPLPGPHFDYLAVGGEEFTGFFAHWNKNANAAADFDHWFLNLFPRPVPFNFNHGGYETLNFIPSIATMTFGLMAGELLRGPRSKRDKFLRLVAAGGLCLAIGWLMEQTICPSVKRIWTPTWAVYSSGWTFLMLAGFFGVIDGLGFKSWSFFLVVVGMNSIAIYCMAQLLKSWVRQTLHTHLEALRPGFGQTAFSGTFGPIVESLAVLFVFWLACLWLYRQRIFIRI